MRPYFDSTTPKARGHLSPLRLWLASYVLSRPSYLLRSSTLSEATQAVFHARKTMPMRKPSPDDRVGYELGHTNKRIQALDEEFAVTRYPVQHARPPDAKAALQTLYRKEYAQYRYAYNYNTEDYILRTSFGVHSRPTSHCDVEGRRQPSLGDGS